MQLAEKCADTFSRLKRNEKSKNYYLKQVNELFHSNSFLEQFIHVFLCLVKTCTRIKYQ